MITIKEIMDATPVYCYKTETVLEVAKRVFSSDAKFIPVINDSKEVVGLVTYMDICLALGKTLVGKTGLKIHEFMTSEIATVSEFDDDAMAYMMMRAKKINTLAVVNADNKLCGSLRFITVARRIVAHKKSFPNNPKAALTKLKATPLSIYFGELQQLQFR